MGDKYVVEVGWAAPESNSWACGEYCGKDVSYDGVGMRFNVGQAENRVDSL